MAKFAVSAGHSTRVKGAIGIIDEAIEVAKIAPLVVSGLRANGHQADLAPNDGSTQSAYLAEEYNHANAYGGTGVSIHMNSFGNASATGTEVYYYRNSARILAERVSEELSKALGIRNRGAKKASFKFLTATKGAAILIEVCFVSNAGDVAAYRALGADGTAQAIVRGLIGSATSDSVVSTPTPSAPATSSRSVSQMADEVIAGKHGSGHDTRQRSLGVSASVYAQVRAEVNRRAGVSATATTPSSSTSKSISKMADEVIAGKHGNGHSARQSSLGVSSAIYAQVRAEVNRRAGVSAPAPTKSIDAMAREVIAGKHGNGHANRQKSLGISDAAYKQVRARVNQLA